VDGVHRAVQGRIIVLAAGGDADYLRFDVLGDFAKFLQGIFAAGEPVQRRADGDVQGGGTRDAAAMRRLAIDLQVEAAGRLEELDQQGGKRQTVAAAGREVF
jgi:hypothetical protein